MHVKEAQNFLRQLFAKVAHPRIGTIIGMQEELGKLSKSIMEIEIYGSSIEMKELENNCADVFFGVIDVCNAYGIDLEKVSQKKIEVIKSKIKTWEKEHGEELKQKRAKFDI